MPSHSNKCSLDAIPIEQTNSGKMGVEPIPTSTGARRTLRRLELEAYASVVSAFRAQGSLTTEKKTALELLSKHLGISSERHRAEIRRAVNDELLTCVAECISSTASEGSWRKEGQKLASTNPRFVSRQITHLPQTITSTIVSNALGQQVGKEKDETETKKNTSVQLQNALKLIISQNPLSAPKPQVAGPRMQMPAASSPPTSPQKRPVARKEATKNLENVSPKVQVEPKNVMPAKSDHKANSPPKQGPKEAEVKRSEAVKEKSRAAGEHHLESNRTQQQAAKKPPTVMPMEVTDSAMEKVASSDSTAADGETSAISRGTSPPPRITQQSSVVNKPLQQETTGANVTSSEMETTVSVSVQPSPASQTPSTVPSVDLQKPADSGGVAITPEASTPTTAVPARFTSDANALASVSTPLVSVSTSLASVSTPLASVSIPLASVSIPLASVSTPLASVSTSLTSVSTSLTSVSIPLASVSIPLASVSTPLASVSTPLASVSTPLASVSTSLASVSTPLASVSATLASVSTPLASVSTPLASVSAPLASVSAPLASVSAPLASVPTPLASVSAPLASVSAPLASVSTPLASVSAPLASVSAPLASVSAPLASVSTPLASVSAPLASVSTPLASVSAPLASVSAPLVSVSSPLASVSTPFVSSPLTSVLAPLAADTAISTPLAINLPPATHITTSVVDQPLPALAKVTTLNTPMIRKRPLSPDSLPPPAAKKPALPPLFSPSPAPTPTIPVPALTPILASSHLSTTGTALSPVSTSAGPKIRSPPPLVPAASIMRERTSKEMESIPDDSNTQQSPQVKALVPSSLEDTMNTETDRDSSPTYPPTSLEEQQPHIETATCISTTPTIPVLAIAETTTMLPVTTTVPNTRTLSPSPPLPPTLTDSTSTDAAFIKSLCSSSIEESTSLSSLASQLGLDFLDPNLLNLPDLMQLIQPPLEHLQLDTELKTGTHIQTSELEISHPVTLSQSSLQTKTEATLNPVLESPLGNEVTTDGVLSDLGLLSSESDLLEGIPPELAETIQALVRLDEQSSVTPYPMQ